jgi:hypothetical protein
MVSQVRILVRPRVWSTQGHVGEFVFFGGGQIVAAEQPGGIEVELQEGRVSVIDGGGAARRFCDDGRWRERSVFPGGERLFGFGIGQMQSHLGIQGEVVHGGRAMAQGGFDAGQTVDDVTASAGEVPELEQVVPAGGEILGASPVWHGALS